jgi:septum formation protein
MIYLASQSPRRQDLLKQIGVPYTLLLADKNENAEELETILPGQTPALYVQSVVERKLAAAVLRYQRLQLPALPVLCADTTVALGSTILGKPESDAHAAQMLSALSGRTHKVLTAIAVARADGRTAGSAIQTSRVRFARLSKEDIAAMVQSGEPRDKAGAYALQGLAARYIRSVQGSPSGIIGLPLYETMQLLRRAGWQKKS